MSIFVGTVLLSLIFLAFELSQRHAGFLIDALNREADRTISKILARSDGYAQLLRSAGGYVSATDKLTRDGWRRYFEEQRQQSSLEGIQGLGFSKVIRPVDLESHVRSIRDEGFADYQIKPPGTRDLYTSIVYLEPFSGRNLRAFGYDMFSEATRRKAMELARDSGNVAFSGRVTLVQETVSDVQAGFLAYYPVYARNLPHETVEERRTALIGWTYSPYRARDMFSSMFRDELKQIRLEIFDGSETTQPALLFDSFERGQGPSGDAQQAVVRRADLPGRPLTVRITALPEFASSARYQIPWIEYSAIAVIALLCLLITWMFVTSRRRAESEITLRTSDAQAAAERAQILLRNAADGIHILDDQGNVIECSDAFCRMLGYSRGDILAMNVAQWDAQLDADEIKTAIQNQLQSREVSNFETRHRRSDGTVIDVEITGLPVDFGGRRMIFNSSRDITVRKLLEYQLRQSETRFKDYSTASADWFWEMDASLRFTYFSDNAERVLGVKPERLMGRRRDELAEADELNDQEKWNAHLDDLRHHRPFREFEYHVKGELGGRWFSVSGVPVFDTMGAFQGYRGTGSNVTRRKNAEMELRQAKVAAEAANIAKSRFLATMSHEIRTPLNGILGMAQLLLQPGSDDRERDDFARTILNSGKTLLSLVTDILDLSKVESGKMEIEYIAFETRQITHEIQQLFRGNATTKSIALRVDPGNIQPRQRYLGDALRLRQMLSNLVGNAIKFTEKGEVVISVIEISRDEQSAVLEFSVRDSGTGIPEDVLDNLFSPFVQADNSTTRKHGGSGLGLSIVKRFSELMGGKVGAESTPGKGSRFWFQVQVEPVASGGDTRKSGFRYNALPEQRKVAGPLQGHVLIVEDDPTNHKVIAAMLTNLGLHTSWAQNGKEAVELVTGGRSRPDIILMDCQMPIMDGYEATRLIRVWECKGGNDSRLSIIALTAGAYHEDRKKAIEAGMDDFLSKPIDLNDVKAKLGQWLPVVSLTVTTMSAGPFTADDLPRFDETEMLRRLGGNRQLGKAIIESALSDLPGYLEQIGQSALDLAQRAAHTAKGLLAQIGAVRASSLMKDMDDQLKQEIAPSPEKLAEIRAEYEELVVILNAWSP